MRRPSLTEDLVADTFLRLFVAADGVALRREDRQKVRELHGLLDTIGPLSPRALLVDAAAGKGSVGIMAAALLGARRVIVLERHPPYAALARAAADRLAREFADDSNDARLSIDVRERDVAERTAWPERPDLAVALHACGPASDHVLDAAIAFETARSRAVLLCGNGPLRLPRRSDRRADGDRAPPRSPSSRDYLARRCGTHTPTRSGRVRDGRGSVRRADSHSAPPRVARTLEW